MYPPPIESISASDINDYHIEEKYDCDDKNSFKDHRYDEHHRDAGLAHTDFLSIYYTYRERNGNVAMCT